MTPGDRELLRRLSNEIRGAKQCCVIAGHWGKTPAQEQKWIERAVEGAGKALQMAEELLSKKACDQ